MRVETPWALGFLPAWAFSDKGQAPVGLFFYIFAGERADFSRPSPNLPLPTTKIKFRLFKESRNLYPKGSFIPPSTNVRVPRLLSWHFQHVCLCLFTAIPFCTHRAVGRRWLLRHVAGLWSGDSGPYLAVVGQTEFKKRITGRRHSSSLMVHMTSLFSNGMFISLGTFYWKSVAILFLFLSLPFEWWFDYKGNSEQTYIRKVGKGTPNSAACFSANGTTCLSHSLSPGEVNRY